LNVSTELNFQNNIAVLPFVDEFDSSAPKIHAFRFSSAVIAK